MYAAATTPQIPPTSATQPTLIPGMSATLETMNPFAIVTRAPSASCWRGASEGAICPKVIFGAIDRATKSSPMNAPPAPAEARKKVSNEASFIARGSFRGVHHGGRKRNTPLERPGAAADHPNVKQYASTPGSENSTSN